MFQLRRTGVVLFGVGVLASCSGGSEAGPLEQPPEPASATTEYTAAYDDVVDALEHSAPDVEWTAEDRFPQLTEQDDGRCVLVLAESLSEGDLYESTGGLADLAADLDPVLEKHGFDPLSAVIYPENGGDVYVSATDPTGWELEVAAYPPVVEISGPVETDECDESVLGES
ncbi:hypothetical protein [Myceligenerans cantabricum]